VGNDPILRIKGLTKFFGGLGAVVDLDMDIDQGQIIGIIGPNGAGKSTALNMIAGSMSPTRGELFFQTQDVTKVTSHGMAKRGLARVFQSNTLFENVPVITNVRVGLYLHTKIGFVAGLLNNARTRKRERELNEEALEILKFVGLSDQRDRLAVNLPHGRQRALCLAVALAVKPKLLLLDEPLTGMNSEEVGAMISLIKALRDEKGMTSIVVEHNMTAVMDLCDRITVLNYGRRIAEGRPSVIAEDPLVIEAYLGAENDAP
jgi:branched-chain amino acid transport system ATP-binding protein